MFVTCGFFLFSPLAKVLYGILFRSASLRDEFGAGIMFRDVTTLLLDHKAFKDTIDIFVERYRDQKVDVIVGAMPLTPLTYHNGFV